MFPPTKTGAFTWVMRSGSSVPSRPRAGFDEPDKTTAALIHVVNACAEFVAQVTREKMFLGNTCFGFFPAFTKQAHQGGGQLLVNNVQWVE